MTRHFFDVGANVGQTFEDYLNKTPAYAGWDVWCFEPSPRHLPALMVNAQLWSSVYRVHVCPFGIRGESGLRRFWEKDDPRGDSFEPYLASDHVTKNLPTGYELCSFGAGILDTINALTRPGDSIVLKLDCEGSEFSILRKLLTDRQALSRIKMIYVEFHHISEAGSVTERNDLILAYSAKQIELRQWMF